MCIYIYDMIHGDTQRHREKRRPEQSEWRMSQDGRSEAWARIRMDGVKREQELEQSEWSVSGDRQSGMRAKMQMGP